MKVGFTGTRKPRTPAQVEALRFELAKLAMMGMDEFHHGACVGADAEAVAIQIEAREETGFRGVEIVAHPGVSAGGGPNADRDQRAVDSSDSINPEKSHFARNRDIVDACDVLLAVPPCRPLPASGGTAYTVGYALKQGKPVRIIWPDGEVTDAPLPPVTAPAAGRKALEDKP